MRCAALTARRQQRAEDMFESQGGDMIVMECTHIAYNII
jgi:hypothetical protein